MDEDVKIILDDHEKRIRTLEQLPKSDIEESKKEISIKEFLLSKKPKDDVQRTLFIGYFLEKNKGFDKFNTKDIEDIFREAKEKVPDNIHDKVNKNIKKGLIMQTKEKKDNHDAWTLTSTGEQFVENGLNKKE